MPVPFMLDGKLLPWLASATHIGHELHESGSMDLDTKMKKAEFIGKSTEIRETFNFASPVEVLKAVKLFAGDLYGAMLWDLSSFPTHPSHLPFQFVIHPHHCHPSSS